MRTLPLWLIYGIVVTFLTLFFLWPVGHVVGAAFLDADGKFTAEYFVEVFRNPIYVEGLANAFWLGVASTALSVALALPLALLADRFTFTGKALLTSLILVPMILPPFVGAIGIRQIFGQYGALNAALVHLGLLAPEQTIDWLGDGRFWGIAVMNALHLYPIIYLNLTAALANIDPAMEEAAANLGCTGVRRLWRITAPLVMPGLLAGCTIVFIFAFTELGVPLIFDFARVTSVQIFIGAKEIAPGNPFPFALVVALLVSSAVLYSVAQYFLGPRHLAAAGKASTGRHERSATPQQTWLCWLAFAGISLVALLPHAGVIFVSLAEDWYRSVLPNAWTAEHYQTALGHSMVVPSIANSLKYASASMVLDLVLGLAIAVIVVRSRLPGRQLLDAAAMLPLAVPGLVLAFGYIAMTQSGSIFAALNPARDPTLLLIIAYAVRRLPYVVRSAAAGLQQTSVTLEEAAQNLGASPARVLQKITLPLIAAHLMAGGLLAFAFAMLEVSDSLILAQRQQDFPITKAIYELFQLLGDGRYVASALGVWAMLFLGLTIFIAGKLLGKRLGALFRI